MPLNQLEPACPRRAEVGLHEMFQVFRSQRERLSLEPDVDVPTLLAFPAAIRLLQQPMLLE